MSYKSGNNSYTVFNSHGPNLFNWPQINKFSSTLNDGNNFLPSGTIANPFLAISSALKPFIDKPL